MTGDATVTKWNTPFKIAFLYNPDEKKVRLYGKDISTQEK